MKTKAILSALAFCVMATGASAELQVVKDQSAFLNLVKGRDLTRLGITLQVSENGEITGRAFGKQVSGAWQWNDSYFCRSLFWGEQDLGNNCQQVAMDGGDIRFTSDRGAGKHANFGLE